MNSQTLLNRPQTSPAVVARISKISSLVVISNKAEKASTSLRKVFEKGTYQKKTQLSILKRYKKRLDYIQKQNDKNFVKRKQVKLKLPEIKKYAGNFFTKGSTNDPLRSIGALAAFNTAKKISNKDYLGAVGPGLVAAGIFLGLPALKMGIGRAVSGSGKTAPQSSSGVSGATAGSFWGTPYSQTAAGKSYAGMQQFRNLPQWARKLSSSSASRFSASNERIVQGTANLGDRLRVGTRGMGMQGVGGMAENLATSGMPKITPRVGLLNAALFGLDFMGRKSEGQTNLQAGVGAGAGVGGALIGAAIGSMLFPGVGTLAGFLIGAAFSTGGALIATKIADSLTGADKLSQQTEEQKKLVDQKKKSESELTFNKTLNRYERVVNKFEKFSKSFTGTMGGSAGETAPKYETIPPRNPTPVTDPYTGPVSGDTFLPLPGATSIGDPNQRQNYGADRGGRSHAGVDLTENKLQDSRAPVAAYKTGKVIKVEKGDLYPGGAIEIDHGGGLLTRYLHITPQVNQGQIVYGGQQIAVLHRYFRNNQEQTHLHFEVYRNNAITDPTSYITGVKNKIPRPLTVEKAKETYESSLGGTAKPRTNTMARQQSPEEFFKNTRFEGIFKEQNKREQFYGEKPGGYEGSSVKVKATDETVIQAQQMYNAYVRDLRSKRANTPIQPEPTRPIRATPTVTPSPVDTRPSYAPPTIAPINIPVPIPTQRTRPQIIYVPSSSPVPSSRPSEQQLLNSFYKRVLLNTVQ